MGRRETRTRKKPGVKIKLRKKERGMCFPKETKGLIVGSGG